MGRHTPQGRGMPAFFWCARRAHRGNVSARTDGCPTRKLYHLFSCSSLFARTAGSVEEDIHYGKDFVLILEGGPVP